MNDTAEILPDEDDDGLLDPTFVSAADVPLPELRAPTTAVTVPVEEAVPEAFIKPNSETIPLADLPPNTQNLELIDGQYYHNGVLIPEDHSGHPIHGDKPWAIKPGNRPQGASHPRARSMANRINVREMVGKLTAKHGLHPVEVLYYIMVNDEDSRKKLGFKSTDRVSPNLQQKAAMELLAYMAPKLKSIEVKSETQGDKAAKTHIFLPNNNRTGGPMIVLPEKDGKGQTFQLDPQTAAALILDEEDQDEYGGT